MTSSHLCLVFCAGQPRSDHLSRLQRPRRQPSRCRSHSHPHTRRHVPPPHEPLSRPAAAQIGTSLDRIARAPLTPHPRARDQEGAPIQHHRLLDSPRHRSASIAAGAPPPSHLSFLPMTLSLLSSLPHFSPICPPVSPPPWISDFARTLLQPLNPEVTHQTCRFVASSDLVVSPCRLLASASPLAAAVASRSWWNTGGRGLARPIH